MRRAALPEPCMHRSLAFVLVAAVLGSIGTVLARQPEAFIVAIVRDDGLVLPVATLDRGRWRTPWPSPVKEAEVPVRLDDCPLAWWGLAAPPRQWTLYTSDASPRPFTVDRATWVPTYCQQQVVLQSRAARREPMRRPEGSRVPKHGVAVTGDAAITLPRAVEAESAEGRALLDAVQAAFNREERLMLARDYFAVYSPSVPGDVRDRLPVHALSIHAGPARIGGLAYYVELERRYPRRSPPNLQWCDEVTYMTGWAHQGEDDRLELSLIGIDVTSCLLDSVVRITPHAIIDSPRGPVWLLEEYRSHAEAYSLFLAPDRTGHDLLVRRFAGFCPDRD
jgi:hypothetical protein